MNTNVLSFLAPAFLLACLAATSAAHASCSPVLTDQIRSAQRIVDSLRPDKAGQMRVLASDGSEYTAGQALWMKGQLRFVARECVQGNESSASSHLNEARDLLRAHHRES